MGRPDVTLKPQPLKVTFELAAPVIPADKFGLHLDGLIAYAAVQEALLNDPDYVTNPPRGGNGYFHVTCDLSFDSLAMEAIVPHGVIFMASMLEFEREGEDMLVGMTRRTDDFGIAMAKDNFDRNGLRLGDEDYIGDAPMIADFPNTGVPPKSMRADKIDLASGERRNFQFFLPAFQARRAVAWCMGDPDRIRYLLTRHIKHVGRKGTAGYGAVSGITVETDEAARENWMRRAMPVEMPGYAPVVGNLLPPYWKAENRRVVWVPV